MADFKFEPMRSLIYVDCVSEDYRPKLQRWIYKVHIPDSISQFEPMLPNMHFIRPSRFHHRVIVSDTQECS